MAIGCRRSTTRRAFSRGRCSRPARAARSASARSATRPTRRKTFRRGGRPSHVSSETRSTCGIRTAGAVARDAILLRRSYADDVIAANPWVQSIVSAAGWWDADWLRSHVVDANDGIIAIAGVVEGLTGAGASDGA